MDTPKKIPLHVLLRPEDRDALVREAKERRVSLTEIVARYCQAIAKRQAAADCNAWRTMAHRNHHRD